jgi:hypothetical protein
LVTYAATLDVPRHIVEFLARLLASPSRIGDTARAALVLNGNWK